MENERRIKEFNRENRPFYIVDHDELHIVLNIYRLKHSAEYADLGDFYMALRYIFGMVRNGNSPELNSAIGYQMMSEFSMLGNIYADKFSTK